MEQENYFIVVNQKAAGPLQQYQIQNMLNEGIIQTNTLIWKKGWDDWKAIHTIQDFEIVPLQVEEPVSSQTQEQEVKQEPDSELNSPLPEESIVLDTSGLESNQFDFQSDEESTEPIQIFDFTPSFKKGKRLTILGVIGTFLTFWLYLFGPLLAFFLLLFGLRKLKLYKNDLDHVKVKPAKRLRFFNRLFLFMNICLICFYAFYIFYLGAGLFDWINYITGH